MHPLEWFLQQKIVIRADKEGKMSEKKITSPEEAQYYFSLQEKGYTFTAKKPRIHVGDSFCSACEG